MMGKKLFEKSTAAPPLYYFEDISRIPRESGNEKQVSDYILKWAADLGLEAWQDEQNNLLIKKDAYPGQEQRPPVILQAHMDMVCEKRGDSTHDFLKDEILLKQEGDLLMSAVGTTLGADDGIGVAYCMAVLASEDLKHPPIEVILTTEEESTFNGAANVSFDRLEGRRLINLDYGDDQGVLCGSCGGMGIEVQIPVRQSDDETAGRNETGRVEKGRKETDAGQEYRLYQILISGLCGGHSGEDIHRGNGSAIQLLTRLLRSLYEKRSGEADLRLVSIHSGTSRLAISREAAAEVLVARSCEEAFKAAVADLEKIFAREYAATAPNLRIAADRKAVFDAGKQQPRYYIGESFRRILDALTLFPDGIMKMNGAFPGLVESSLNLGIVSLEGDALKLVAEIRGAYQSTVEDIKEKVICLAECLGGSYRTFSAYCPWEYRQKSGLREAAICTYHNMFGQELKPTVVHAGIECGFFLKARPDLDAIALGPNCWHFHSPEERMSISSALKVWEFLKKLLEEL